jgi:hypothetical protein
MSQQMLSISGYNTPAIQVPHYPTDCFTPGERARGTHWTGGWVGPTTGLDDVEWRKILPLPGLELPPLGRPTGSQSLY